MLPVVLLRVQVQPAAWLMAPDSWSEAYRHLPVFLLPVAAPPQSWTTLTKG